MLHIRSYEKFYLFLNIESCNTFWFYERQSLHEQHIIDPCYVRNSPRDVLWGDLALLLIGYEDFISGETK